MTVNILPIRDPVHPGQCFRDYVNEIADNTGWFEKKVFYLAIGIKNTDNTWTPGTQDYLEAIKKISSYLCIDQVKFLHYFDQEKHQTDLGKQGVGMPSLLHQHPRICQECCIQEPYIRSQWIYTPFIMCHEHKCLLIDQCPECKERLSWELKHRFICPCGHDYLQKKTPFGNMNPQNIKDLAILIDAIDIEQLIKVVNRIARPIDFLSARVPMNSQSIKDLFFLFAVATTYIFDNDYQKHFENTAKLKRNLQLTNNGFDDRRQIEAIEIPPIQNMINIDTTLHLRFRSADTDIVQLMALSRHQHYNWVVFSRRDYGREMSYEDLANQCNTKQAGKLLFIPTQHIGTLINDGIISPLKGMRSTRDTLFDARSFKNLVVKTSTLGKPKSRISFQEILDKKHMDLFNASSYNLLQAVLLGDITAYADTQRDLITCVLFDREELNGYFDR